MGPDFLIIGGQKCGTTSLYRYIGSHPGVATRRVKETHFFDRPAAGPKAVEGYRNRFDSFARGLVTGEATPYYLFHPHAPRRAAAAIPDAKLIVLLRNPADRAISQYHHERPSMTLEEALEQERELLPGETEKLLADETYASHIHQRFSFCARGEYAAQLKRWFGFFPRVQFLILQGEEFYANPGEVCDEVFEFLGLAPFKMQDTTVHHEGKYQADPTVRERLSEHFAPHNRRLYELLGVDYDW